MIAEEKPLPILRQISIRAVMQILMRGPRSRADLAVATNLSKQTMSDVMRTLETAGWVREIGTTVGRLGRSAILYEIDSRAGVVLGLDIGASRFKLALFDVQGKERAALELSTASLDGENLVEQIVAHARDLVQTAGNGRPLVFACLATPGVLNPETGHLTMAPNLAALTGFDLPAAMREGLGCEVIVENDVNAAIVGERWQGAARRTDHAAYISLGSGVGLGIIAGGQLMRGATGAAGEVSYLPFGYDSADAESLRRGALERSLGVFGVLSDFAVPGGGTAAAIDAFKEALAAGNVQAVAARNRIGELGSMLVLSVQAIIDPQVVVVGGLLGQEPLVFEALSNELARRTQRFVALRHGALGLRAAVTGASYLALSGLFNQVFAPKLEALTLDLSWPEQNGEQERGGGRPA